MENFSPQVYLENANSSQETCLHYHFFLRMHLHALSIYIVACQGGVVSGENHLNRLGQANQKPLACKCTIKKRNHLRKNYAT